MLVACEDFYSQRVVISVVGGHSPQTQASVQTTVQTQTLTLFCRDVGGGGYFDNSQKAF
jgi:hypothetical protein